LPSALRTVTTSATATTTTTTAALTALARLGGAIAQLCLLILLRLLCLSGRAVGTRRNLLATRRALRLAVTAGAVATTLPWWAGFARFARLTCLAWLCATRTVIAIRTVALSAITFSTGLVTVTALITTAIAAR
jgi:hypothetical protein